MATPNKQACYAAAMRMLVRREHSVLELTQKLNNKEFEKVEISETIDTLIEQNYQSDKRFADEFIQMRFNQGKGPIKIRADLKQRGIDQFDFAEFDFYLSAYQIREQKFGKEVPSNFKEKAKQQRFLQSRGFSFEHISQSFKDT
ncbi:MAG: regulatory protein RecX [Candidatus Ruthia sp.]|nr:regulatory protein RecX [Candidatus Ruthturnera sp.]MBT4668912.1 regulatory protein RecX [Candidatus Ruthturnera sp.]